MCLYKPMSELRNFAMTDGFECARFILEDHAEIKNDIGLVAQDHPIVHASEFSPGIQAYVAASSAPTY